MESQKSYTSRLKEKGYQFYGLTKDNQSQSPSLIVKKRDGNQIAFNYQYLSKTMEFNPSEGIMMSFTDPNGSVTVHIEGRNLLPLWDALSWHKITFITESTGKSDTTPENELCVTEISIREEWCSPFRSEISHSHSFHSIFCTVIAV